MIKPQLFKRNNAKARDGQVTLYLLGIIVVICLVAVMNVRTYVRVRAKMRVTDAGDAAALAAARVQMNLLNEIGRLNLEHLAAFNNGDTETCEQIVLRQRRLILLGPIEALRAADDAAGRNGIVRRQDFADILRRHINDIRALYFDFPEPWPGAWEEYAAELESAIALGLAAGPDNCEFYNAIGEHPLSNPLFYSAIAARAWCWFRFNAPKLLTDYSGYDWWGDLPGVNANPIDNCEIFSLHIVPQRVEIDGREDVWFFYDAGRWRKWREIDPNGERQFPVSAPVKPEYDFLGASAVCRVHQDDTVWSAAAKCFGVLKLAETEAETALDADDNRREAPAPDEVQLPAAMPPLLVLPRFEAVRLIPVDAAGGAELGSADVDWVNHLRDHLPGYLENGIGKLTTAANCRYCSLLRTWEKPTFRAEGARWLKFHASDCRRGDGGDYATGGTRHGH